MAVPGLEDGRQTSWGQGAADRWGEHEPRLLEEDQVGLTAACPPDDPGRFLTPSVSNRHLVPLFASGALRPIVDRVLSLAQAADAHRAMQSNDTFGKVVLEVP